MTTKEYTQEEANQFILDCHSNLEAVEQKVADNPTLVNAYNPETDETALGAAAHMGNRKIAEFLLGNGGELDIACAAMLGRVEEVDAFLQMDPQLATSGGAHGIPIAFHAAIGGNVQVAERLLDHGAEAHIKRALMPAIHMGHIEMTRWLLEHGADLDVKDAQGNPPLYVAQKRGYTEIEALLKKAGVGK